MDEEYIHEHFERWHVEFVDKINGVAVVAVLIPKTKPLQPFDNKNIAIHEARKTLKKSPYPGIRKRADGEVSKAYMVYD